MPMEVIYTGIDSADKLYNADITGNLVPPAWCHKIVNSNGKPNMNAVMILAEIVYWYRPKAEYIGGDQNTVRLTKKFKADLLQLSYGQLEKKFNLGRDQCKRALDLLESMGLIKRRFRTVILADGRRLNNVMYIDLFTDKLLELTDSDYADPVGVKPHRVCDKPDKPCANNHTAGQVKPMTNTENTTEISNKDYNSIYQDEIQRVRDQVDYEALCRDVKADFGLIDEMISIIADNNLYAKDPQWIDGSLIPAQVVRERLKSTNSYVIRDVLESLRSTPRDIVNTRGYILTALFNAASTYHLGLDTKVTRDMYRKEAGTWGS